MLDSARRLRSQARRFENRRQPTGTRYSPAFRAEVVVHAHARVRTGVAVSRIARDLGLRPIFHRLEHRVEAHIFVAFLAYCLQVTLKNRLQIHAPGLSPTAVMEKMATIQMIDVWIPTRDDRWLVLPRHTEPSTELRILLDKLQLTLPSQPPPRITAPVA